MQRLQTLCKNTFAAWRTLPNSSPQRWFVVVALFFGAIFAVIAPAYDISDEYGHLARAYQIGHGQFLATKVGQETGGLVPTSFKKIGDAARAPDFALHKLPQLGNIPLNTDNQIFRGFPNLVIYSPVVYAPQAVGLDIGELLHMPAFYVIILARLCNLAIYTLLFYWAIRLLPFGKWAGVVLGLLPMHILLAGSLSADPVSIGLTALMIGLVLYLRDRATLATRRQYVWLLGLVAATSLTKLPFPLLISLLLFLPIRVLGSNRKQHWQMIGGIGLVALLAGGGWLLLANGTMVSYGPQGVDPAAQVASLHTPIEFIKAFVATYSTQTSDNFLQNYVISVGPVLAWLPIWATYAYTVFLAASLAHIRSASKAIFNRAQKQLVLLIGIASFLLISLLLYVSWTPVNGLRIDGLQSRYFTPFLLLLIPVVAASTTKKYIQEGLLNSRWYRYVPVVYLTVSVIAAFYYFYTIKIVIPF